MLLSTSVQSQLQKLYINPKASGREKQSRFIDSIRFIPLEIKAEISLGNSNNIQVTDKYFLITDFPEKAIYLYAKSGGFIKKINFKKLGEGFYPSYDEHVNQVVFVGNNKNYTLTPKDEIKILLDWSNPRNRKYFRKYIIDLNDTSFVIKKDTPTENDIIQAVHFYDEYYWRGQITTSPLYKDSLDYEIKIYKNNEQVNAFFPYNRVTEPRFLYTQEESQFMKTDAPNIHFVTRPFCDTVYKMINDSIFPAYQVVLPLENSLPATFFTRPFKNKTDRENFLRNNGMVFHEVSSFYETREFLFFSIHYLRNYESYVYQKNGNITYKLKNIKADTSDYNLQLLNERGMSGKGNTLYKPQKAGDLLAFFEKNPSVPVPAELEAYLKNNPQVDAPVIVEFKLKN
jgi:hypothetical protein